MFFSSKHQRQAYRPFPENKMTIFNKKKLYLESIYCWTILLKWPARAHSKRETKCRQLSQNRWLSTHSQFDNKVCFNFCRSISSAPSEHDMPYLLRSSTLPSVNRLSMMRSRRRIKLGRFIRQSARSIFWRQKNICVDFGKYLCLKIVRYQCYTKKIWSGNKNLKKTCKKMINLKRQGLD